MAINDDLIEDYRVIITNTLLSNDLIVEILGDGQYTIDECDELLSGDDPRILPYQFVPDTITEAGSYIMYDMEENAIFARNSTVSTYTEVTLYFWLVTHKKRVRHKGRLTQDILVRELKKEFGEQDGLGIAKNHFVFNRLFNVGNNNYVGRLVRFTITDWSDKIRQRTLEQEKNE